MRSTLLLLAGLACLCVLVVECRVLPDDVKDDDIGSEVDQVVHHKKKESKHRGQYKAAKRRPTKHGGATHPSKPVEEDEVLEAANQEEEPAPFQRVEQVGKEVKPIFGNGVDGPMVHAVGQQPKNHKVHVFHVFKEPNQFSWKVAAGKFRGT